MRLIDADMLIWFIQYRVNEICVLNSDKNDALISKRDVLTAIDNISTADRWIPCSESLPEENGYYLVSDKNKVWICEMLNIMGIKGWSNNVSNPIVEYWMPSPKPYEPYKENDE